MKWSFGICLLVLVMVVSFVFFGTCIVHGPWLDAKISEILQEIFTWLS